MNNFLMNGITWPIIGSALFVIICCVGGFFQRKRRGEMAAGLAHEYFGRYMRLVGAAGSAKLMKNLSRAELLYDEAEQISSLLRREGWTALRYGESYKLIKSSVVKEGDPYVLFPEKLVVFLPGRLVSVEATAFDPFDSFDGKVLSFWVDGADGATATVVARVAPLDRWGSDAWDVDLNQLQAIDE
jgi:hypothetical protein